MISRYYQRFLEPVERFMQYVEPEPTSGCWLWTGARSRQTDYGSFSFGGSGKLAHRVAWELFRGDIPPDLHVLHRCDTPPCVNPGHLWLGTELDNMRDRDAKGRRADFRGERHGASRLTAAQVVAMRQRYALGNVTSYDLAGEYGVSPSHVQDIIRGDKWAHIA